LVFQLEGELITMESATGDPMSDQAPQAKKQAPDKTKVMLKKIKTQMQNQVLLMQRIVGENDLDDGDNAFTDEQMVFSTKVPKRLREDMREAWPVIRRNLAELSIDATLDLVASCMTIKSLASIRSIDMLKARDLLKLLARGFPAEQAILVLRSGWNCDFIKIGGQIATREEFERRRNRLIGPQGTTLKAIELLTGCYLLVYGNTVCVLGKGYIGINQAGEIILDCMNKINPISHIRRLVIMRELDKDPRIRKEDYYKFLPPVKKNEEIEGIGKQNPRRIDFLLDDPWEMTFNRRLALYLLRYKWYNVPKRKTMLPPEDDESEGTPKKRNDKDRAKEDDFSVDTVDFEIIENPIEPPPRLEKAWAHFEHSVLPRYMVNLEKKKPKNFFFWLISINSQQFDVAEPGEDSRPTRMYSPLFTPLKQMGDFGVGIGLYFSTLRSLAFMALIAGCINIPNMRFYGSSAYASGNSGNFTFRLPQMSAQCNDTSFVPCPSCNNRDNFKKPPEWYRVANVTREDGSEVFFALKNQCNFDRIFRVGMFTWGTMIFLLLYILYINSYSERMEINFDEDEQTAQDYSLIVENPPPDSIDPHEWKDFFEKITGGHVTVCTVAVDNDLLLRTLVERRSILEYLREALPPGTKMSENNLARISAKCEADRSSLQKINSYILHPFGIMRDVASLYNELVVLTSKVRGLSQIDYPVTKVYISFETEGAQRSALNALSLGKLDIVRQKSKTLKKKFFFRGKTILKINEPQEPSTVRWQDLNSKMKQRLRQVLLTTIVSLCALGVCAFLVFFLNKTQSLGMATLGISFSNSAFPMFAKAMTSLEFHPSESSKQSSLYVKIALFRWVNTAIIIAVITPFTSTITVGSEHLINAVQKIFVSEILTMNGIQLLDIGGFVQRHILGRKARSQTKMNKLFQGTSYELAERYTNMTKIMFLSFFYLAIYPGSLWMCALALFINYFTDAFSLMKTWAPAPKLGNSVSKLSRKYFFSLSLLAVSIFSAYFYSGFPYDNLCTVDDTDEAYIGEYEIRSYYQSELHYHPVSVNATAQFYEFCNMDYRSNAFPTLPIYQEKVSIAFTQSTNGLAPRVHTWMTKKQSILCATFGWTSIAFIIVIGLRIILDFIMEIKLWFKSDYEPAGMDMQMNFSNVDVISAYIPQVRSDMFLYPLIACDVEHIDEDLFDWKDPDRDYIYYSVLTEAKQLLKDQPGASIDRVFSQVMHWPPGVSNKRDDDEDSE